MLSAILIDDHREALDCLALELEIYYPNEIKILAQCPDAIYGLSAIKTYRPDLVFVDIDMPEMSGIALIRAAHAAGYYHTAFVITTWHEAYAIEAFKEEATHYLLKPWSAENLKESVRRAYEKKKLHKPVSASYLTITTRNEGKQYLPHHEIVFCEADGNYTMIHGVHTSKGKNVQGELPTFTKLVSKPIKAIEKSVQHATFFRVHYSYLVNLTFIEKYQKGKILLKHFPEKAIPLAKDRRVDFFDQIEKMTN